MQFGVLRPSIVDGWFELANELPVREKFWSVFALR